MTEPRRTRRDSLAVQGQLVRNTSHPLPTELEDLPRAAEHFAAIMARRLAADWSDHDIWIAGQMVRLQVRIDLEQDLMAGEDAVIDGRENPRTKVIGNLFKTLADLRRALGLQQTDKRSINVPPAKAAQYAGPRNPHGLLAGLPVDEDDGLIG